MYVNQIQCAVAFPAPHKSAVQKLHGEVNWPLFIVKSHFCLLKSCFIVSSLQVLTDTLRSSCLLTACGFDQLNLISLTALKSNEKHCPSDPDKKTLNRLSARAAPRHKQLKTVIFQFRLQVLMFTVEHSCFSFTEKVKSQIKQSAVGWTCQGPFRPQTTPHLVRFKNH